MSPPSENPQPPWASCSSALPLHKIKLPQLHREVQKRGWLVPSASDSSALTKEERIEWYKESRALPLLGQYHVEQVLREHDSYWMWFLFIYLTDKEKGHLVQS